MSLLLLFNQGDVIPAPSERMILSLESIVSDTVPLQSNITDDFSMTSNVADTLSIDSKIQDE